MTSPALSTVWLQLLAALAVETALLAFVVALLRRWNPAAAWSRVCCQAGITAVLVITAAELSGAGRGAAAWMAGSRVRSSREEAPLPAQQAPIASIDSKPAAPQAAQQLAHSQSTSVEPVAAPSPSSASVQDAKTVSDSYLVLGLWLVWAAGALVGLARAGLARLLVSLLRLRRRPNADPLLADRVQVLARALGMKRRVRVLQSARLNSPVAFGLIRPTVGLPLDFATSFDAPGQEAILAHEVAHLAAYDPFWCFLADVAAALLWWHPAVWWMRRQLHVAGELVADEASLLVADGPEALAQCLVALGTSLSRQPLPGPLGVASFRSHLGRRVHRLVHMERRAWAPPRHLRVALFRILGAMAMSAMAIICTAWATPRALTKGDSMNSMQLNWKRSLATFALLAAFNGPEAKADTNEPAPPASAPTPAVGASAAVAPANPTAPDPSAEDAFARRYGLRPGTSQTAPPTGAVGTRLQTVLKRLPTDATPTSDEAPKAKPGAQLEAKLKHILLSEVAFDGLPLGEVLKVLSEESLKRDPEKTGVNFLINPNAPLAANPNQIDVATGLPMAVATESVDLSAVTIKFNLPLRHVTMKDVLDAVVKVADHPIDYTLEDYAVVFSLKPQTIGDQHVVMGRREPSSLQLPMLNQPPPVPEVPEVEAGPVKTTPERFNIDFGEWRPKESKQVGAAAAGAPGDYWNVVGVPWNDAHTEGGLKCATREASPIRVEMLNLGGAWGNDRSMGIESPMLDHFSYPAGNKGGSSKVILHGVPAGKYQVFLYGHGKDPRNYGDYALSVGDHSFGRKSTTHKSDATRNTKWVEGSQYVKFSDVKVEAGENLEVFIRPGEPFITPDGRTVADAMICGLQLIPVK